MKHKLFTLLLAVLASVATMNAEIYNGTCGSYMNWELNTTNKTLTFTGGGSMTDYSNASSVPWYSYRSLIEHVDFFSNNITSIGSYAFYNCTELKGIIIPSSITSIGNSAFGGCTNLKIVHNYTSMYMVKGGYTNSGITANAEEVHNYYTWTGTCGDSITWSFHEPTLTISGSGTMENYASYSSTRPWNFCKSSLQKIVVEEGIEQLGTYAFCELTNVTSVSLPSSLRNINKAAFMRCYNLQSINIPDSIEQIYQYGFYMCKALKSISIPNTVTYIGETAFYECDSLQAVHISDIGAWCNIEFISNPLQYAHNLYLNGELVTDLIIPECVTKLKDYVFNNCQSITSVTIPENMRTIGYCVFSGCDNLRSVTWNAKGAMSFEANSNYHPFNSIRTQITSFTFGTTVEYIPSNLCVGMTNLTSIVIPNSVIKIYESAFKGCSSLSSVTIPNSVVKIDNYAFAGCTSLPIIDNIRYADTYLVEAIDKSLSSYSIREGTRFIGDTAFKSCSLLNTITFPNSVIGIGSRIVSGCDNLTAITIPDSVAYIASYAFNDCESLSHVIWNAKSCQDFSTEYYDSYSGKWVRNGANVFSKNITSFIFGDNVEEIPNQICYGMTHLTSLVLPDSLRYIGKSAFYGCMDLTSVTFTSDVRTIGEKAFYGCSNLKKVYAPSVEAWCNIRFSDADANPLTKAHVLYIDNKILRDLVIPCSITSIGKYAFQECSTLSSITIPGGVSSIGENAFYNCNGVSAIYNYASIPQTINSNTLYNVNRNFCTLYVPAESIEAYQEADVWNTFLHIEAASHRCGENLSWEVVNDTLIISGSGDMWDYYAPWPEDIKAVVFPDSLTKIGAGIFYSNNDIGSVTCYATVPPNGGPDCGLDRRYNINLLVPEESIETYSSTPWWQDFLGIYSIGYLPYEPFNLHAEPGPGKVTVSWEANENPDWYIITYYLNGKYYTNDGLSGENRKATHTFHNDTTITLTWSITALGENNEHVSRETYGEAFTVQPSPYEPHNVRAESNGDGTYTIRWTPGTSEEINYYQVSIYSSGYQIWNGNCLHPDSSIVTSVLPWAGNYSYQIIIFDTNQNILGYSRWNYLTVDPVEEHSITTRVLIQPNSGYNTNNGVTLYRCLSVYETDTVTAEEEGNGWYSYTWTTTDPGIEVNMVASYWSGISVSRDTCMEYTNNLHLVSCDAHLMDYTPFNLHAEPGAGEVTLSWEAKDIANRYRVCLYEDGVESYSKWYNGDVNSITITLSNDLAKTYTWSVSPYVDGMGYLNAVYSEVFTVQPSPFIPQNLRAVANGDGTYTINWDSVENERVYRYLFQLDYPNDMGYYTEYTNTASFTTGILPVIGEYTYQVKCIDSEYSVLGVSSSNFIVEAPEESRDITIRLLIRPYSGYNTDNGVTFFLYSYLTSQWTAYEAISEGGYWYSYTINTNDIAIGLYFDEHYSTISGDTCLQYVNGDELMSVDCNTVVSNTTITVAQAIEIGQALEHRAQTENMYIVVGYVSALIGQETDFELYNNQTYWITDERGSTAASAADGAFQVFRGTASEKVQVGDKVSVYGVISRYDEIIESVRPQVIILEKNPEEEPAEVVQLPYSESFLGDMGLFTVHDVAHDTLPYVWLTTDLYGMKASGYRSGPHNTESWLVSPKISLPAAGNINMTFETCLNYASDDYNSCAVKILVDNTWSDLQFNKWPAGHSWVFDTVTTTLDAYAGNEIQIAFVYRSSTLYSNATWEVRNLEIKQIEEPIVYSPIQIGDLYYILDRENQTAVVTSKSFYQSDGLILVNEGWDIAEAVIPATVTYNDTVYEVTRIGWWAFRNCQNLTSVTIGDNVHVIDGAFYNCTNLQEVNMSNSVDTIDSYSFYECPALTSIVIPASVDSMGLSAFQRCNNLTSVTINSNAVVGKDFNSEYIPDLAYIFGWQVQEYIIGEGVTRIGYHAFNHFSQKISQAISHLTSISLPSTLTDIASEAFYNCVKLTSLTIPDGVATIGEDAFLNVRSVFYNGNASGAPWGALCLNSVCETEPEPEPEPIEPAVISVTDNSLEDWNELPAAYVVEAVRPIDATYTGLKNVKVYATKSYINILVEPDMDDVTDLEWVPFHIFIDTDNSDLTGGYGDMFEDANTDILLEGSLFEEGEAISYAPGVFEWWGEIGGEGWEWTDPNVEHSVVDNWGAIIGEGELAGCSSQYVDGKFEIQILRNNIPATWNDSVFGIGFEIEQEWISVGILPLTSPTDENPMGKTNKLKVRIHKANDPTEVEPIGVSTQEKVSKFFHNGQILIRRGDKIYTLTGQEVK